MPRADGFRELVERLVHEAVDRQLGVHSPAAAARPEREQLLLEDLAAGWLEALRGRLDELTIRQCRIYACTHFVPFFRTRAGLTTAECALYAQRRLRHVLHRTVAKELSALRSFCAWCYVNGWIEVEPAIPALPRRALGTPDTTRPHKRATVAITPEERHDLVLQLPEHSPGSRNGLAGFPLRDRFIVAAETALRPATLNEISAPDDYHRGAEVLVIRDEVDKARFGRELPLSAAARGALDRVCPATGPIFGCHRYRQHLKAAAAAVLGAERARHFSAYDLRHSRLQELCDAGGPLSGVAFIAGHRQLTTTNIYAKPSQRAALEALRLVAGGKR